MCYYSHSGSPPVSELLPQHTGQTGVTCHLLPQRLSCIETLNVSTLNVYYYGHNTQAMIQYNILHNLLYNRFFRALYLDNIDIRLCYFYLLFLPPFFVVSNH
jgi:hypothetical protein